MENKEKKFITPVLEIVVFTDEDIITGSGLGEEEDENMHGY